MKRLVQIDLPYACYGIEIKDGIVISAPPISKWMVGVTFENVKIWVKGKGGTINESLR